MRTDRTHAERSPADSVTREKKLLTPDRIQFLFRDPEQGGVTLAVERQTRFGKTDAAFYFGGYRRIGDWTLSGRGGVTPNADFYFRQSVEGQVSKRVVGTWVAQLRYRYLNFPTSRVHVLSPAVTYYYSKGELEGRLFLVRNSSHEVDSQSFLVRGHRQLYPEHEVVVVNDGSEDQTLDRLKEVFELEPRQVFYRRVLSTGAVRAVYRSRKGRRLTVIDKVNGGKADALNCVETGCCFGARRIRPGFHV